MNDDYHGILIRQTDAAMLIEVDGEEHWIPRSLVDHCSKGKPEADGSCEISFSLPAWKAKQLGWEY